MDWVGTNGASARRRIALAAGLLAAIAGVASAAAAELVWAAQRPLRWQDFSGRVPKSAAPKTAAMTAAALRWSYDYSLEWSRHSCSYRITRIGIEALFDPQASWVRPENRNAAVLVHEQGHFDIAEIHKRMFAAASRRYLDANARCRGRDRKSIAEYVERDIAATLGKLYERTWQNQARLQALYDAETEHGMNTTGQEAWLRRIAAGLSGNARFFE